MKSIVLAVIAISSALFLCLSCGLVDTGDNLFDPANPNYRPPTLVIDSAALKLIDTVATDSFALTVRGNLPQCLIRWQFDSMAWSDWTEEGQDSLTIEQSGVSEGLHTLTIQASYDETDSLHFNEKVITIVRVLTPVVKTNKISVNGAADYPCTLSVAALGSAPLSYQWYKDTVLLKSQTDFQMIFPSLLFSDSGTYTCVVSNSWGKMSSGKITLSVAKTNYAPVWTKDILVISVPENSERTVYLSDSCSDKNGDILTFTMDTSTVPTDSLNANGVYFISPGYTDSGSWFAKVSVSDGEETAQVTIQVTIVNVNRPPVFVQGAPRNTYAVEEGALLRVPFKATDADGDSVIITLKSTTLPRKEAIVFLDSVLTWQSNINDDGVFKIVLEASDGVASRTMQVDVGVGDVNLPPRIAIQNTSDGATISVLENDTLRFIVTASDENSEDSLTFSQVINAPYAQAGNGTGGYDTVTGVFWYVPSYEVSSYEKRTVFPDVSFTVRDNGAIVLHDTFSVSIEVANVNRAPLAFDTSVTIAEDNELDLSIQASDPDGDKLSWTLIDPVQNGTITGTLPNITYTPALNFNGLESFSYKVTTPDRLYATAVVRITVTPVNDAPVALEGFMSTPKDIPVEVTLQATDPEGDNLSWRIVDSTKNGTLSGTLPKVTYTPTINFYGTDTLIFTVSDGKLTSQQTRYVFSTIFRNNAPIVKDTSIVVREDDSLVFKLPVTDPENDNLILTIVGRYDETKSSLTLPGQNVKAADLGITYRPAKDKNGTDWFTYMVSDHENASRTATVTVTITPVADKPIVDLVAPSAGTIKVVPQGATLSYAGSDADNDELSFSVFLGVDSTRLFQNGTQRQTSLQTGYPLAGFGTLFPGKKYYWGVVVIDGSVAELRDTSAIWSFSTKNEAPVWTTLPSTADTSHYRIRWNLESLCMSPGANGLTFFVSGAGASMEPGTSTLLFQADSQMISITAIDSSIPGDVVSSVVSFRSYSFVPAGMKRIPAKNKSFSMGLTLFEHEDMTPHTVLMTYDYYMDTTEVTQGQYQTLTSRNPSYYKSGTDAALRPVEYLTWYDAVYFCNQRSKASGLDTVYSYESIGGTPGNGCSMTGVTTNYAAKGFRLATEAEWEFACRGGTTTHYFWGNSSEPDSIKPYAWYNLNADSPGWTVPHASYEGPQPVGTRLPNTFGLYDMTGNITEWCNDWFEPYDGTNKTDPTGPTQGENRVRRGGAWAQENWYNSSGVRLGNYPPNSRFADIGFRCVFRP